MKRIVFAALSSMALAACQGEEATEEAPAAEETAAEEAAAWGGTYETTNAEGETATWVFAEDGTYTADFGNGETVSGTYTAEEGSTCLDPTEPEGEEDTGPTCFAQGEPGEDGSWISTAPDGSTVTVRSVEAAAEAAE